MSDAYVALLEDRIDIAAPPARVWELVGDVRRMADFSPQVDSCAYTGASAAEATGDSAAEGIGVATAGVGTTFVNQNSHGKLRWATHGEIVRFEAGREIAFRIAENRVVWVFRLEPTGGRGGGGTALTQQRTTPDGISDESLRLTERYLGGQETFTQTMRRGMRETLERIKAAAERP